MSAPKHPRIESVIAASHGQPREILEDVVGVGIQNALSEDQQTRLSTAVSEVICAYPDRIGRYKVWSPEGVQGDETRYSVDMKYETAKTCTCGDYMFRCDPASGQMCKHMWRINLLINLGALPEPEIEPYDWLLDELFRDRELLEAMETEFAHPDERPSYRMSMLIEQVQSTHRIAVDYPQVCAERATILESIYETDS